MAVWLFFHQAKKWDRLQITLDCVFSAQLSSVYQDIVFQRNKHEFSTENNTSLNQLGLSKLFTMIQQNLSLLHSKHQLWKFSTKTYTGTTLGWTGRLWHFFQNWNHKRYQNMVLISFVNLQKIHIFWKFGGCSSKFEPAILKLKWA